MQKLSIEDLAIQYLANQCKARHNAEKRFGIHYMISEDFGAIVLACSSDFLNKKSSNHGFNYPKILKVNFDKQYVSEIEVEYNQISEIADLITQHLKITESNSFEVRDKKAYQNLIALIKEHYPNHPINTKPSEEELMNRQRIINQPITPLYLDSFDLDEKISPK